MFKAQIKTPQKETFRGGITGCIYHSFITSDIVSIRKRLEKFVSSDLAPFSTLSKNLTPQLLILILTFGSGRSGRSGFPTREGAARFLAPLPYKLTQLALSSHSR
jgi:hypothetical protein